MSWGVGGKVLPESFWSDLYHSGNGKASQSVTPRQDPAIVLRRPQMPLYRPPMAPDMAEPLDLVTPPRPHSNQWAVS